MKKSLIISGSFFVLFLSLLLVLKWYEWYSISKIRHLEEVRTAEELKRCDEIKSSGLAPGVEKVFQGQITPTLQVRLVLKCDYESLVIEAFDTSSSQNRMNDLSFSQIVESGLWGEKNQWLVDPGISSDDGVDTGSDFNFDGYNDLTLLESDGQGSMAVDTYKILLFDPSSKRFVYNADLSAITNIGIDATTKRIISYQGEGFGSYTSSVYAWDAGVLSRIQSETCAGDTLALQGREDGSYTLTITTYTDGKAKITKKETKKAGTGSCGDVAF